MCYICGREYGTASLEIHLKTCKKKFENEQSKLPPNQRKPVPEPPKLLAEVPIGGSGSGAHANKMDAYNDAAFDTYNTKALEPCPNCGRTFLPESLVKH